MKVLFLCPKKTSPSCRWRIRQILPGLEEHGITGTLEEIPAGAFSRLAMAKRAGGFDAVVLQKRLLPKLVLLRLRRFARTLVYEFDEAVTLKRTAEGIRSSVTRERRFRRTLRCADAVITSTEVLADLARPSRPEGDRVHVLPTVTDLSHWPARTEPHSGTASVLGWLGTPSSLAHLEVLREPLARLCRRHESLTLRVLCVKPPVLEGVRFEHKPYLQDEEVRNVQSFDIALAPLIEDPWTRGKISTKLLAYLASGLPIVASDVEANRIYLRKGENGFLCGTLTEWEETLERLITDPELRSEMGACARASAERRYSLDVLVPRYATLLKEAVESARPRVPVR